MMSTAITVNGSAAPMKLESTPVARREIGVAFDALYLKPAKRGSSPVTVP
jgi:hypothetical protein